jgi:hypothetical protein
MVALMVTANGVGSFGSHIDGPATSSMWPIRTSFAVHGGFPPTFCTMHLLLLYCANAGAAVVIAMAIDARPYRMRRP